MAERPPEKPPEQDQSAESHSDPTPIQRPRTPTGSLDYDEFADEPAPETVTSAPAEVITAAKKGLQARRDDLRDLLAVHADMSLANEIDKRINFRTKVSELEALLNKPPVEPKTITEISEFTAEYDKVKNEIIASRKAQAALVASAAVQSETQRVPPTPVVSESAETLSLVSEPSPRQTEAESLVLDFESRIYEEKLRNELLACGILVGGPDFYGIIGDLGRRLDQTVERDPVFDETTLIALERVNLFLSNTLKESGKSKIDKPSNLENFMKKQFIFTNRIFDDPNATQKQLEHASNILSMLERNMGLIDNAELGQAIKNSIANPRFVKTASSTPLSDIDTNSWSLITSRRKDLIQKSIQGDENALITFMSQCHGALLLPDSNFNKIFPEGKKAFIENTLGDFKKMLDSKVNLRTDAVFESSMDFGGILYLMAEQVPELEESVGAIRELEESMADKLGEERGSAKEAEVNAQLEGIPSYEQIINDKFFPPEIKIRTLEILSISKELVMAAAREEREIPLDPVPGIRMTVEYLESLMKQERQFSREEIMALGSLLQNLSTRTFENKPLSERILSLQKELNKYPESQQMTTLIYVEDLLIRRVAQLNEAVLRNQGEIFNAVKTGDAPVLSFINFSGTMNKDFQKRKDSTNVRSIRFRNRFVENELDQIKSILDSQLALSERELRGLNRLLRQISQDKKYRGTAEQLMKHQRLTTIERTAEIDIGAIEASKVASKRAEGLLARLQKLPLDPNLPAKLTDQVDLYAKIKAISRDLTDIQTSRFKGSQKAKVMDEYEVLLGKLESAPALLQSTNQDLWKIYNEVKPKEASLGQRASEAISSLFRRAKRYERLAGPADEIESYKEKTTGINSKLNQMFGLSKSDQIKTPEKESAKSLHFQQQSTSNEPTKDWAKRASVVRTESGRLVEDGSQTIPARKSPDKKAQSTPHFDTATRARPAAHDVQTKAVDPQVVDKAAEQLIAKVERIRGGQEKGLEHVSVKEASKHKAIFELDRSDGSDTRDTSNYNVDPNSHQMSATLSGNATDRSYMSFLNIYKEFAPLALESTGKPEVAIKVAEASKREGIEVQLSESDDKMLKTSKYAELYAQIQSTDRKTFQVCPRLSIAL